MTAPVIRVESLSKRYHIGTRQSYDTLRERLVAAAAEPWRRLRRFGRSSEREQDTIWALKDVSFEVQPGEVVGIIGRNGAGKSTLLKILTRITEPTCGRAELHGRVGSLLEVGTGFHPELTGRENIFLSGAILGMTSQEIRSQFDAIIDFSGIEKFIDTPVKRYSSGMHVRLGFAIAAHLQPEILLVDEVLAVGDAEFQKKCLGKMDDVAKGGRTVLFVSHNMGAVERLCAKAILLEGGCLTEYTCAQDVVGRYMHRCFGQWKSLWETQGEDKLNNKWFRPTRVMVCDSDGVPLAQPNYNNNAVFFRIEGEIQELDRTLLIGYVLETETGTVLFRSKTIDTEPKSRPSLNIGHNILQTQLPKRLLNEGRYVIRPFVWLSRLLCLLNIDDDAVAVSFEISGGMSDSPDWTPRPNDLLAPIFPWVAL
jgi:lipopolysaccharide transport system ATP-binding protein